MEIINKININWIYLIAILIYFFLRLNNIEKFTEESEENKINIKDIDNCIHRNYLFDNVSLNNLNTIVNNFNSDNKLVIPSSLNLSDTKLVINKESNIYSGPNKIDFFKSMISDNDEVEFVSWKGQPTLFANCNYTGHRDSFFSRPKNNLFKITDLKNLKSFKLKDDNRLNTYVNGKDGKNYHSAYNGNLKFNKYTNTKYYKHNSKEAHEWRKQFIKKCDETGSKYDRNLCNKVKNFKPLPILKKGNMIY